MEWELKSDRPIYAQLLEELKRRIVSGFYKPGERLMSVRELAQDAKVNPNTMQRALAELERQSLVFAVRTTGRYITEDVSLVEETKKEFAAYHVAEFSRQMKALGYDKEGMQKLLSEYEEPSAEDAKKETGGENKEEGDR